MLGEHTGVFSMFVGYCNEASELHCNIPSLPNDSAKIANLVAVADKVNTAAQFRKRCGVIANRENYAIRRDKAFLAGLILDGNAVSLNLGDRGLKMNSNLV